MSSWVSYSSNYYCLLLAVAEGAACVACVAHLVSKSVYEAGLVPQMYNKAYYKCFIYGHLSEMGIKKTLSAHNWT